MRLMIVLSSIIPSHDIAAWILQSISRALGAVGLPESPVLEQVVYVVVISALALAVGYLLRKVVLLVSGKVISMRASEFAQELLRQQVIQRCSHIVPPIVILALLPFAFEGDSRMLQVVTHLVVVYLLVMFGVGMNSVIGFVYANYNRRANKDNHPLKGVMGVAKGVLWIIIVILCAAELMQKSPVVLFGGLGAFAAVLMLIFKDSILGFVAGIQLSGNDMLRVGDWIVVPSTIANGVVEDVTLTVVKVRNWDNTLVMLPAYSLVASPFQNWRGMSDSGVRQIDRQVLIDTTSILPLDEALIASVVAKYSELKDYVDAHRKEGAELEFNGGVVAVNGTVETNLGLFRAYLCQYLLAHPAISTKDNIIVRLLEITPDGAPLDIYCFTRTTDWLAFEAIRTQVVEHVVATAPDFGLRVFNSTNNGLMQIVSAQ